MRRPLFNFLAVAGAVLLAAIGVSAQAHGSNMFGALSALTGATVHTDITTEQSTGDSVEATGAREQENKDQTEPPETQPSTEPAEAPEQDNDSQGDDNNDQGGNDNGGATTGGGGDDHGGGD